MSVLGGRNGRRRHDLDRHLRRPRLHLHLPYADRWIQDKAYVARILGSDPTWRYRRTFLDRYVERQSEQRFGPLFPGAVYEYRHVRRDGQSGYSYGKDGGLRGIFRFVPESDNCDLDEDEIVDAVEGLDLLRQAVTQVRTMIVGEHRLLLRRHDDYHSWAEASGVSDIKRRLAEDRSDGGYLASALDADCLPVFDRHRLGSVVCRCEVTGDECSASASRRRGHANRLRLRTGRARLVRRPA